MAEADPKSPTMATTPNDKNQNSSDKDQGKESSSGNIFQQPGEVIAPDVPDGFVEKVMEETYGFKVTKCKQLNGYDDKNYHVRVASTSSNQHVTSPCPHGYVVKVVNTIDTRRPSILYAQIAFMDHLRSRGIPTQVAVPSVKGENITFHDFPSGQGTGEVKTHAVCVRTFLPGTILYDVTLTHDLCYKVGVFLASMTKALEDFYHPFYDDFDCLWSMVSIPKVKDFVHVISDVSDRRVVDDVIEQFETSVLSRRHEMRKGYCHGDPNEQNILVRRRQPEPSPSTKDNNNDNNNDNDDHNDDDGEGVEDGKRGEYEVAGILDFQDATLTHPLFDLALCIGYVMIMPLTFDPLEVGGHVLAGYTSRMSLSEAERSMLRTAVAGRLVQSLVLGAYNHSLDPGNAYLLTTGIRGWGVLHSLWDTSPERVERLWDDIVASYRRERAQ